MFAVVRTWQERGCDAVETYKWIFFQSITFSSRSPIFLERSRMQWELVQCDWGNDHAMTHRQRHLHGFLYNSTIIIQDSMSLPTHPADCYSAAATVRLTSSHAVNLTIVANLQWTLTTCHSLHSWRTAAVARRQATITANFSSVHDLSRGSVLK